MDMIKKPSNISKILQSWLLKYSFLVRLNQPLFNYPYTIKILLKNNKISTQDSDLGFKDMAKW